MSELTASVLRMWHRLQFVIGRGRTQVVNDAGAVQIVQVVLSPKETPDLPRVIEFGLASNPPAGTDAIAIFIAGDRANGVVIATNNQALRPKNLQPGEVQVYDGNGQSVYLSKTGIVINGGGNPIKVTNIGTARFETALLECTGDIKDNCDTTGRTMAAERVIYNEHNHAVENVQGGASTIITNPPNPSE